MTLGSKVRSIIVHYTHVSITRSLLRAGDNAHLYVCSLRFAWSPWNDILIDMHWLHFFLWKDLGDFRRLQKTSFFHLTCLLELEASHLDLIIRQPTPSLCTVVSDLSKLLSSVVRHRVRDAFDH